MTLNEEHLYHLEATLYIGSSLCGSGLCVSF